MRWCKLEFCSLVLQCDIVSKEVRHRVSMILYFCIIISYLCGLSLNVCWLTATLLLTLEEYCTGHWPNHTNQFLVCRSRATCLYKLIQPRTLKYYQSQTDLDLKVIQIFVDRLKAGQVLVSSDHGYIQLDSNLFVLQDIHYDLYSGDLSCGQF